MSIFANRLKMSNDYQLDGKTGSVFSFGCNSALSKKGLNPDIEWLYSPYNVREVNSCAVYNAAISDIEAEITDSIWREVELEFVFESLIGDEGQRNRENAASEMEEDFINMNKYSLDHDVYEDDGNAQEYAEEEDETISMVTFISHPGNGDQDMEATSQFSVSAIMTDNSENGSVMMDKEGDGSVITITTEDSENSETLAENWMTGHVNKTLMQLIIWKLSSYKDSCYRPELVKQLTEEYRWKPKFIEENLAKLVTLGAVKHVKGQYSLIPLPPKIY